MAKLILVGGSLATGKSTMAQRIADTLNMQRISLDEIKESLFDVGGYRDREWSKQIGALAFPVFRDLIEMHLARGEGVVADATFLWIDDLEWIHRFTGTHGVELKLVWMSADPHVARERFVHRANASRHPGHNDALEQVMDEFDERFFNKSFIPLPIEGETKIVDTTNFDDVDHDEIFRWI